MVSFPKLHAQITADSDPRAAHQPPAMNIQAMVVQTCADAERDADGRGSESAHDESAFAANHDQTSTRRERRTQRRQQQRRRALQRILEREPGAERAAVHLEIHFERVVPGERDEGAEQQA